MKIESKEFVPAPPGIGKIVFTLAMLASGAIYGALLLHREPYDAYAPFWLIFFGALFAAVVWRLLFMNDVINNQTLRLDPEGLRLGEMFYRWHDIDQFGVLNDHALSFLTGHKQVYWTYRSASRAGSNNISSNGLKVVAITSSIYKLDAAYMAASLNDWMQQYSGRSTTVHFGPTLPKQRFQRTVFVIWRLTFLAIAALWIFLKLRH